MGRIAITYTRQQATRELIALGGATVSRLKAALASKPSLELRTRVESILRHLEKQYQSSEELRILRAIQVLEHIGSAEACQVLEKLAGGAGGVPRTLEALASLSRLRRNGALPQHIRGK